MLFNLLLLCLFSLQETVSATVACMHQDLTTRHSKCLQHSAPLGVGFCPPHHLLTNSCAFVLLGHLTTSLKTSSSVVRLVSCYKSDPHRSSVLRNMLHCFSISHCSWINQLIEFHAESQKSLVCTHDLLFHFNVVVVYVIMCDLRLHELSPLWSYI